MHVRAPCVGSQLRESERSLNLSARALGVATQRCAQRPPPQKTHFLVSQLLHTLHVPDAPGPLHLAHLPLASPFLHEAHTFTDPEQFPLPQL